MTCKPTESSAPPVMPGTYAQELQRLIRLANQPGWKAWAWKHAQDLDVNETGLWRGISTDLKNHMTGLGAAMESEGQSLVKHR